MAKKISKHSRAARRNETDEPEAKELYKVDRAEKTDLASAIIRATIKKNEDLLHNKQIKKQEKNKISKKKQQGTKLTNDQLEKALSLNDRLEVKIMKSKLRAKMIQNTRKANWDQINSQSRVATAATNKANDEAELTKEKEDAMKDDIYAESEDEEGNQQKNAFSLLDEVEA